MKLSELVNALVHIQKQYPNDLDVYFTASPSDCINNEITQHDQFFVAEEQNDYNKSMCVDLRTYPY